MATDSKTHLNLNELAEKMTILLKENLIRCFKQMEEEIKKEYPKADTTKTFAELFNNCGFDQSLVAKVAAGTVTKKRTTTTKKRDPNKTLCNAAIIGSKSGNKTCSRYAVTDGKCKTHAAKVANGTKKKTAVVSSKNETESVASEEPVSDIEEDT